MLRKISVWLVKLLISIVLVSLIFSSVSVDFSSLIKGVFADVFQHASADAQSDAIAQIRNMCSSLSEGDRIITINEICANRSILDSMKENCVKYRELKKRDANMENDAGMEDTCAKIESGEVEELCRNANGKAINPNFGNVKGLCDDYRDGRIDDKELFSGFISSPLGNQQLEGPRIGVFEKYSNAMTYLNENKLLYFIILMVLITALYLLSRDTAFFVVVLTEVSFGIGIFILAPYLIISLYKGLIGFDTTEILKSLFGNGNVLDLNGLVSVILLMFLKMYNSFIALLGVVFLMIGVTGKVYEVSHESQLEKAKSKLK